MTRLSSKLELSSPVTCLRGIGPARSRALEEAGLRVVGDLLTCLPVRYEDRSTRHRLAELELADDCERVTVLVRGRLEGLRTIRTRRRGLTIVEGTLVEGDDRLRAVWFNRPYLVKQIDSQKTYWLHGQLRRRGDRLELLNASVEESGRRGVVPIYPSIAGLSPTLIAGLIQDLLDRLSPTALPPDPLPPSLRARHGLQELAQALTHLHCPPEDSPVERLNAFDTDAHRRLIYGELFAQQLELARRRSRGREPKGHRYRVDERLRQRARELLPFRLTGAQRRVLGEIVDDLRAPPPMSRLLQGDVGCGKTIVAALAMVVAMESDLQVALMAPTELLAEQHERSLRDLFGDRYRGALLSGGVDADDVRAGLHGGDLHYVVGTQALIQESTVFRRLGLVIVDEQHRFGVRQRRALQDKAVRPDLLIMTATPIPRSLAMTAYGDLDVSVIDEQPPGRQPVETHCIPDGTRRQAYRRVLRRLEGGERGYVVLPLIEDSEHLSAESLAGLGSRIERALAGYACARLHGRMSPQEREQAMSAFAAGDLQVLIATTIIEVGVDVPSASFMVIESAERFGLAQLHQLRGRVGRGHARSVCLAVHSEALTPEARARLEAFRSYQDGFRLAEEDLRIRGPGDLLGTRQSGVPDLTVADLVRDRHWLERARADAREWLAEQRAVAIEAEGRGA